MKEAHGVTDVAVKAMRVRYSCPDGWPRLTRTAKSISHDDRRLSRLEPPPALPLHCKPWLDAHSHGILMVFPFEATVIVRGHQNRAPDVEIASPGGLQPQLGQLFSSFSRSHFGLATEYTIRTDLGVGLLVLPVSHAAPGTAVPVRGLVETWWYPKPLFLVFEAPRPGEVVTFQHGQPLCVLAPVLCERPAIEEMAADEAATLRAEREEYDEYLAHHPELRWTSADGHHFSSAYKAFSKRRSAGGRSSRVPGTGQSAEYPSQATAAPRATS